MKRTIDLNSTDWCDVVFEGKNKEYGAYAMRQTSGKRHVWAFGIMTLGVALVAALPHIMDQVKTTAKYSEGITSVHVVSDINVKEEKVIPEIPKMEAPPAREYIKSIQYTPPVITKDVNVGDDEELKGMNKLLENPKIAIGYVDRLDGKDGLQGDLAKDLLPQITGEGTGGGGGGTNTVFKTAEVMPQFPGGTAEMYKYISENLKYPAIDQEIGTQGKVVIQFVVGMQGEIKEAKILRGVSVNCDKEAMRVVKGMPKWIPGRQNGNLVQVYFTLPITFRLK